MFPIRLGPLTLAGLFFVRIEAPRYTGYPYSMPEKAMTTASLETFAPEDLHPSIWRASQLPRSKCRGIPTGFLPLDNQLPGGVWPSGTITELLLQQNGIGEITLLAPALQKVARRKIVLLQPPQVPHIVALSGLGLEPAQLLWIKPSRDTDALWACEQVLRSASCGAVLFWATHIRSDNLRRLLLAAQAGETLCFVMRPLAAAQDASPAPLRLSLRPAQGGVNVGFVKRRGPVLDEPLFLPLTFTNRPHIRVTKPGHAVVSAPDSLTAGSSDLHRVGSLAIVR